MRGDLLSDPVEGLDEALAAVDAFDEALVAGLLRPGPAQAAAVVGLADAVAGTPLAARVAEAAGRASVGAAGEDHFVALAAARCALLGSVHDALTRRIDEAVGRPAAEDGAEGTGPGSAAEDGTNLLAAARSWLCDLARGGWRGIDHELVAGAVPVVSAMLPDPGLRRRATLLDGFAAELAASCPGATLERVPVRRWADLWSRALLLTVPGSAGDRSVAPVTGRLLPLGVDVQEHATAVQAQVHAVFEPADGARPVWCAPGFRRPSPTRSSGPACGSCCAPACRCSAP